MASEFPADREKFYEGWAAFYKLLSAHGGSIVLLPAAAAEPPPKVKVVLFNKGKVRIKCVSVAVYVDISQLIVLAASAMQLLSYCTACAVPTAQHCGSWARSECCFIRKFGNCSRQRHEVRCQGNEPLRLRYTCKVSRRICQHHQVNKEKRKRINVLQQFIHISIFIAFRYNGLRRTTINDTTNSTVNCSRPC